MRTIFAENSTYEDNREALKKLSKKQIVLFACDCALKVLPIFKEAHPDDKHLREVIEAAINYKNYTEAELKQYADDADNVANDVWATIAVDNASWVAKVTWAARAVTESARSAADVVGATGNDTFWAAKAAIGAFMTSYVSWDWIYDLYTNAIKKQNFNKTADIQGLIQDIKDNRNFSLMPILFDALEDQGLVVDRKEPYGLSHWVLN